MQLSPVLIGYPPSLRIVGQTEILSTEPGEVWSHAIKTSNQAKLRIFASIAVPSELGTEKERKAIVKLLPRWVGTRAIGSTALPLCQTLQFPVAYSP